MVVVHLHLLGTTVVQAALAHQEALPVACHFAPLHCLKGVREVTDVQEAIPRAVDLAGLWDLAEIHPA